MDAATAQAHNKEKISIARASVFAALLLTGMKLAVGLWTGSLGILSEAAHSGLDLMAAAMTWFSVSVSDRPADATHTYGHSKIDNLSALFETRLLLLTCIWIIYEAVQRLFFKNVEIEVNLFSFGVIIIAVVIDYTRGTALARTAKKTKSAALEADAVHFLSDIASSLMVLAGLAFTKWGYPKADALCSLAVALLVIWISFRLGKKAVDALTDSAPAEQVEQVRQAALAVPGVRRAYDIRMRLAGAKQFIDLKVCLQPNLPLGSVHERTEDVERALQALFEDADILVHAEPDEPVSAGMAETAFQLAQMQGINIHDLQVHRFDRGLQMDMHLEWPFETTLGEAHREASALEERLQKLFPELSVVHSHLESISIEYCLSRKDVTGSCSDEASGIASQAGMVAGVHAVEQLLILESDGRWHISLTCMLYPGMPLHEAHRVATEVEARINA
ncbi:MAG: cation diffusion facilitator family transporter, partial [Proteobacteria bacterium]|nr:cation diffusion facilitator family transporter [Pseudomonadota bacterium]